MIDKFRQRLSLKFYAHSLTVSVHVAKVGRDPRFEETRVREGHQWQDPYTMDPRMDQRVLAFGCLLTQKPV